MSDAGVVDPVATAAEPAAAPAAAAPPADPTLVIDPAAAAAAAAKSDPAAVAPAAPAVPEKYDLKVPDGTTLAQEAIDEIAAFAREQGLSNEAAQKQLDREVGIRKSIAAGAESQLASYRNAWAEATKADPEIGGPKLEATTQAALRARDHYATPALRKMLDDTGYGNHPEVVRLFAKIGTALNEPKIPQPGAGGDAAMPSTAEVLYGKS